MVPSQAHSISPDCCLRAALVVSCLVSVKWLPVCVITRTCVCDHAHGHLVLGLSAPMQVTRETWRKCVSARVLGTLKRLPCSAGLLSHFWLCHGCGHSVVPSSFQHLQGEDELSHPLPCGPGGGNDLIPCWWTLGTRGFVTPLPSPLSNSYFSSHPSIMGH